MKILIISIFTCFSFYYTDKIISFTKEKDPIMIKLKEYQSYENIKAVNGILTKNTMLTGTKGKSIDINKSYEKMKQTNSFNTNLLEYININPEIAKKDNLEKLIQGKNTKEKEISIIFIIKDKKTYQEINYILEKNNTPLTLFIDGKDIEKDIIDKPTKNSIGIYGYNNKYDDLSLKYAKGIIKTKEINISNYCLYINENYLKTCIKNKINTIKPIIIKNNLYYTIKNNKKNGYIYQIDINKYNIKELNTTINYLKQKGYKIQKVEDLLKE